MVAVNPVAAMTAQPVGNKLAAPARAGRRAAPAAMD
jgi:hypothetical protein